MYLNHWVIKFIDWFIDSFIDSLSTNLILQFPFYNVRTWVIFHPFIMLIRSTFWSAIYDNRSSPVFVCNLETAITMHQTVRLSDKQSFQRHTTRNNQCLHERKIRERWQNLIDTDIWTGLMSHPIGICEHQSTGCQNSDIRYGITPKWCRIKQPERVIRTYLPGLIYIWLIPVRNRINRLD